MTSINGRLNDYIFNNCDKPRFQVAEIERIFNKSTYREFLKKIRDQEDFCISRSNGQHRLTVTKGEIRLSEVRVMKGEIPVGRNLLFGVRYETVTTKYFPDKSDFTIKLDSSDEIEVEVNSAVKDFESMMKFVDFELFESN